MRNLQEISDRVAGLVKGTPGYAGEFVIVRYLDFAGAQKYVDDIDSTKEELWESVRARRVDSEVIESIKLRCFGAWIHTKRRSEDQARLTMDFMKSWLWLIGDDELSSRCDRNAPDMGEAALIAINEKYACGVDTAAPVAPFKPNPKSPVTA